MTALSEYQDKYNFVRFERTEGILEMRLHRNEGPLLWGRRPHAELPRAFRDVADDPENQIVVITGTGDTFITLGEFTKLTSTPAGWDRVYREGKELVSSLLDIEVPVVAAVNGPAVVHSEIALLSDIVLASDNAIFQDRAHFANDTVPGDGMHVLYPLLLGWNRGRHFLYTGRALSADEALTLGLVAEVLPPEQLLPRAREVAGNLKQQSALTLRYTRVLLTQQLKRLMLEHLGYGLALEGLAASSHDSD